MKNNFSKNILLEDLISTDKKINIMYHRDMDGIIGAAQILHFLKIQNIDPDQYSFVGCQYKEDYLKNIPDLEIGGNIIIFIDFSPTIEELEIIVNLNEVVVIDHHIGAIKKLENFDHPNFKYWFDMEKAGCGLADEIFIGDSRDHISFDRMKVLSNYAQDRDLWRFDLEESKEINVGLFELFENLNLNFHDVYGLYDLLNLPIKYEDIWYDVDDETFIDLLIELGNSRINYDNKYVNKIFVAAEKGIIPKINIGGIEMFCLNNKLLISEIGNKLTELHYPSCQYFIVHENKNGLLQEPKVVLSFRSTDDLPDVRLVATSLGGNGHRNACGAEIKVEELSLLLAGKL